MAVPIMAVLAALPTAIEALVQFSALINRLIEMSYADDMLTPEQRGQLDELNAQLDERLKQVRRA